MKFSVAVESIKLNEFLAAATPEYRKKANGEQFIHGHKPTGTWIEFFVKSIESYEHSIGVERIERKSFFLRKANRQLAHKSQPIQEDNSSCGVLVALIINHCMSGQKIEFPLDMPGLQKMMLAYYYYYLFFCSNLIIFCSQIKQIFLY